MPKQIYEMSKEERNILRDAQEIKDVEVLHTMLDDHILCADVKLTIDGTPIEISLWWIGWEGVASFLYANDSEQARANIRELLLNQLEIVHESE